MAIQRCTASQHGEPSRQWVHVADGPLYRCDGNQFRSLRKQCNLHPLASVLWLSLAGLTFSLSGCSREPAQSTSTTPPGAVVPGSGHQTDPSQTTAIESLSDQTFTNRPITDASGDHQPANGQDIGPNLSEPPIAPPQQTTGVSAVPAELPKLRADLSPVELIEFLGGADQEMQQIYSGATGIQTNEAAVNRMREIGKLKLEAAKRLHEHADASKDQMIEGARGELQSLSHLAALGDLESAKTLEQLATANLASDDPRLVTDSRLVLIGFGIESLQHGKEGAADHIVDLVKGLVEAPVKPDVPAMMVMGQSRQMLTQYGHDKQARIVRQAIIDLFAGSNDPQVAKMAAQLAGSVRFDAIDKILDSAISGGSISVDQWAGAAETLISESSDIMTVQYLAGAALEFEASDRDDLAQTTYDLLSDQFRSQSDAIGDEARIALQASDARQRIVGEPFDFDMPTVDGLPIDKSEFEGKVILMPFWATAFPQSLQILPLLNELRETDSDRIAIIGLNLDTSGAPVGEFVRQHGLEFPSFQSVSSPTAEVTNTVATRFGMVSMPFVAVIDQQGRVAALDFKGLKLQRIISDLLKD